ncbi:MAG: histidine phosphatase family protein [Chloroflexota bacterium]
MSASQTRSVASSLYLVRHADAGDPSEWIGPDAERPLSGKGVKQAARLAAMLLAAETKIDLIRYSPARRCVETATVLSAVLEVEATVDERLANGPTLSELERMVNRKGIRRLALVGHEPSLSKIVAELTGNSGIAVEKGALIRIDLPNGVAAGAGRLVSIAPPSLFRAPKDER